ncbi:Polygalacturonase ADPG1 [Hordeum vulgare]|nr:Polygalacturonase ADPG1 [Hordeum vulgare]
MPYPFPSFTTMCAAWRLSPDAQMRLTFPANLRHSLRPPLRARYFGNGTILLGAACKVRDVVAAGSGDQAPLASVAGRIRDAVRGLDDELVRSTIDYLETAPTMHAACSMPATSPVPHSLPLSHSAKHAKHAHRIHRPSKRSRHHLPPTVSLSGATPRCQQPMAMASGAPPAPLPVVGQQFCAPYVVPLTVTKKSLSLSDGDFAITDANGAVVLKVKGAIFIIQSRRTILDGAGMPLLTMQEKALVVMNCTDVELSQFSSKDSPQIHIGLSMSGKVNVTQLTITAPENSPNTDGVHVDRSEDVHITGSTIGTGDYCISIGPGSRFVTVDGIVCGPGHGVRNSTLLLSASFGSTFGNPPPPPPPRDRRLLPAALPRQGGRPRLSDLPRGARVVHRLSGSSASGSAARSSSGAAPPPNGIVWSVSKDVTKYASLLAAVGKPTFAVYLGYLVNATLTGVYHANVTLHLYLRRMPPTKPPPATAPADLIVPVSRALLLNSGLWFPI